MKITPAQFDIIHAAIERSQGMGVTTTPSGEGLSTVDIGALAEELGVQWAPAKRMLFHAAKQMGFTPSRSGKVGGQGAKPKTASQKRIDKMVAHVTDLMAKYESSHKSP